MSRRVLKLLPSSRVCGFLQTECLFSHSPDYVGKRSIRSNFLRHLLEKLLSPLPFGKSSCSIRNRVFRWSSHPLPPLFTAIMQESWSPKTVLILGSDNNLTQGVHLRHFTKGCYGEITYDTTLNWTLISYLTIHH